MTSYQVRFEEIAYYVVQVDAASEEEAKELAEQQLLEAADVQTYFSHVGAREVDAIVETSK